MHLLQGIDALLELDVVRRELRLSCGVLTWHFARAPGGLIHCLEVADNVPLGLRTLSSTLPTCSLTYCWVLAAQGVNEALQSPCQHKISCAAYVDLRMKGPTTISRSSTYEMFFPKLVIFPRLSMMTYSGQSVLSYARVSTWVWSVSSCCAWGAC